MTRAEIQTALEARNPDDVIANGFSK